MGKVVANILAACSPSNPTKTLVANLKKDSQVLLEITEDFLKRRNVLHLVSFYETEMTYIAPFYKRLVCYFLYFIFPLSTGHSLYFFKVVDKHSAVLNIPNEIVIGQPSDHRQIVRFGSSKSITFRPVLSRLKEVEARVKADLCAVAERSNETLRLMSDRLVCTHGKESRDNPSIPLEIPLASCLLFLGRGRALDQIQHFFFDQDTAKSRRIFAICGLGMFSNHFQ